MLNKSNKKITFYNTIASAIRSIIILCVFYILSSDLWITLDSFFYITESISTTTIMLLQLILKSDLCIVNDISNTKQNKKEMNIVLFSSIVYIGILLIYLIIILDSTNCLLIGSPLCIALLLLLICGDIESNPGPKACSLCGKLFIRINAHVCPLGPKKVKTNTKNKNMSFKRNK